MNATFIRLRTELRSAWRNWLVLALLIGTFGGIVIGTAAGARRTETAYPRLLEASNAGHALVSARRTGLVSYYEELARRPEVNETSVLAGMPVDENVVAPVDDKLVRTLDRPQLIAGRFPRPERADEAMVNEAAMVSGGPRLGQRVDLTVQHKDPNDPEQQATLAEYPTSVRIVGVGRWPSEVVPTAKFDSIPQIVMTPAAYRAHAEGHPLAFDGLFVRLKDPNRLPEFREAAQRLATERAEEVGGGIFIADLSERDRRVMRAIRPQAIALTLFAGFAGLAGFLVLGQALSRQLSEDAAEVPVLRALGLTRGDLVRLTLLRTLVVSAAGAALAVGVAIAMSPLFPIGAARRAELHDGVEVNLAFLGLGAAAVVVLFLLRAAAPALRLASAPAGVQGTLDLEGAGAPSRLARAAASMGMSPAASSGVRMALEPGRGRSAVAVRATLGGGVVALAAVAASLVFATNLDRVVETPALYGRAWDLMYDASFGSLDRQKMNDLLASSRVVEAWSGGYFGETAIGGRAVTAVGMDGRVTPTIVNGRAPRTDDEIVLGASTLARTKRSVGDTTDVVVGGEIRRMTVVGTAVFPALGRGSFPQTGLGEGALTTPAAVEPPPDPTATFPYFNFYAIDLRSAVSQAAEDALRDRLLAECPEGQFCVVHRRHDTGERPAEIATLDRIRWTPVVLSGVLGALAVATIGHTLVSSIRRRRRELAVLKTLGFHRRQVSAVVVWQATTFAALASLIGLPLGVALGRLAWRALADQLGIVPDVATPTQAVVVAVGATILLANLIAVVPGWLAGRIRPAVALRTE